MSDYIKRSDALHLIERNRVCANVCEFKSTKEFYLLAHDHIKGLIEMIPSADVVERKHGEWEIWAKVPIMMKCSSCGREYHTQNFNYCPNCGAEMRGE